MRGPLWNPRKILIHFKHKIRLRYEKLPNKAKFRTLHTRKCLELKDLILTSNLEIIKNRKIINVSNLIIWRPKQNNLPEKQHRSQPLTVSFDVKGDSFMMPDFTQFCPWP